MANTKGLVVLALSTLAFAACSGKVQTSKQSPDDAGGSSAAGGNNAGGQGSLVMGTPGVPADDLGPLALRRLSTVEYENTVNDILGIAPGTTKSFRPDDPQLGYTNMAEALTVTPLLAEQYLAAASAASAAFDVTKLAGCAPGEKEPDCVQRFLKTTGRRLFRRPLQTEEITAYVALFSQKRSRSNYEGGLRLVVKTMLQSAHFLYKTELGEGTGPARTLTDYEIAAQISYLVTGRPPDADLDAAADSELLRKPANRAAQVQRLLQKPESVAWITTFITHWLGIADVGDMAKDKTKFPGFTDGLRDAVVEESKRFIGNVLAQRSGSLETLFAANWTLADGPLAAHYGLTKQGSTWDEISLPASERLGILTQPAFLMATSKAADSYPIRRGKILRTRILCGDVPPPPPNIKVDPVIQSAQATARERLAQHEQTGSVCAGCHKLIDPLGLAFENYDATGAYRTTDFGKAIDASGTIIEISPEIDGAIQNGTDFAKRIARSTTLKQCASREALRWSLGRATQEPSNDPAALRDEAIIKALSDRLQSSNSDLRTLFVALVEREEFTRRANR